MNKYEIGVDECARGPITLEDFEEGEEVCRIISRGHIFKPNAIRTWFLREGRSWAREAY